MKFDYSVFQKYTNQLITKITACLPAKPGSRLLNLCKPHFKFVEFLLLFGWLTAGHVACFGIEQNWCSKSQFFKWF